MSALTRSCCPTEAGLPACLWIKAEQCIHFCGLIVTGTMTAWRRHFLGGKPVVSLGKFPLLGGRLEFANLKRKRAKLSVLFKCMKMQKLANYVKTHRKRCSLSQKELAFLLGVGSGAQVSRYERYSQEASLKTAFMCEVIFGVPAHELFAGQYQKVETAVRIRATKLIQRLQSVVQNRGTLRKLETLQAIRRGRN